MWIDRVLRHLFPRSDQFFTLLEGIAERISAAAAVFGELKFAGSRAEIEAIAGRLKPIETEADGICHNLYHEIDRTFVTPIDREDLAHLAKALDNVVDGMEHTAAFASLYRLDVLTPAMKELVGITVEAANTIVVAARQLRHFSDADAVKEPTIAVHRLENEADAVYRKATAELFSNGITAIELVRQKDMLFSLEECVDQCEDAMDVIRSVMVKNG
jgi:predicted phosphate transport protein (TIGR00153 family)